MNRQSAILEYMRNDPEIIMISKNLEKFPVPPNTRILTTVKQQSSLEILKHMDELGINFPYV